MFRPVAGVARTVGAAIVLALATALAQAAPDGGLDAGEAAPRSQAVQRSCWTLDTCFDSDGAMPAEPRRRIELGGQGLSLPLIELARGTLTGAQLSQDARLALRLRGGKVGLVLSIRLTAGD